MVTEAVSKWLSDHKALWGVVLILAGAFGFKLITPNARIEAVVAQTEERRQETLNLVNMNRQQLDSAIADIRRQQREDQKHLDYTTRILEALAREQCLRSPRYQTQLTGLPCAQLLQGMGRP